MQAPLKNRLSEKQKYRQNNELSLLTHGFSIQNWPTKTLFVHEIAVEKQIRTTFADIEALAENIKQHGLIHPITVIDHHEGERPYQLVTGERRLRAYQYLKYPEIPARILPKNTSKKAILGLQLSENLQKSDMHLIEIAEGIGQMMEEAHTLNEQKFTQEEIAAIINKPQTRVSEMVRVSHLPEAIKDLLKQCKVHLHEAVRIARIEDPEVQKAEAQRLLERREGLDTTSPRSPIKKRALFPPPKKYKLLKNGSYQLLSWKASTLDHAIQELEQLLQELRKEKKEIL
jgi:ParB/RepB/Spo0J family partition protein